MKEVQGGLYKHSVRLSVCPSVCAESCFGHNFCWFDIGLSYLAHASITIRRSVVYIHDPDTTLNFDLKVKFLGFLTCFLCPFHSFLFDICLPYVAHGSFTMRRCDKYIHVPDLMLTFDFKVKFLGILSCLHVRTVTSVGFHIGIPYLAHGSITVRECVKYIHDPNTTLTFNLKVKFIGFMTWFCVQGSAFLFYNIVILCLALECITMVQSVTYIHELCLTLTFDRNKKIFAPWVWVWRDVFAFWYKHTKYRHMDVSPWDNMCTFLTLVWPWPLTYMWVAGVFLVSFTHSFYLILSSSPW